MTTRQSEPQAQARGQANAEWRSKNVEWNGRRERYPSTFVIRHSPFPCDPSLARRVLTTLVIVLLMIVAPACRRDEPEKTSPTSSDAVKTKQADLLVFPSELRVADSTVNEFVTKAMTVCAAGEYEAFRLLWSVREDPLPRGEFEEGWQAVQTINVRALEKVMLDAGPNAGRNEPEEVYVLLVEVALDSEHKAGQKKPLRQVVLMLTREHQQWRLAQAPKPMREWVKSKIVASPGESAPTPVP